MKKLIQGIVDFRTNVQDGYRDAFGNLATGQKPDALFIACSDSRVVPNTFASTNPGELFVLRNVGNIIPPCGEHGVSLSDESEMAAIEFAVLNLSVFDIIVCGHSECGAMKALVGQRDKVEYPHLKSWLRHGDEALERLRAGMTLDKSLSEHNQLSQLNVLLQLEHLKSYAQVRERLEDGSLTLNGWWFDIAKADVYAFDEDENRFVLIDEESSKKMLERFQR